MVTQKHPLPFSTRKSLLTATLALLALASAAGRAQAQAEEAPAAETPAAAPAGETAAPASEAAKPAPAEAPKCNCPPPCPAPPPPPPAPPVNPVEWKVQSKGGMLITSGNSQSKNFSFGVNGFRKEGNNKLTLEGGLAYGTSNVMVANVAPADNTTTPPTPPTITSLDRQQTTSTNNMAAKGRYDRFLTENNTLYASGQAAADKIAGKTFFGGGQLGYSRQLVKDKWNIVVAELGYDFSYERYVQQPDKSLDPVAIHSARILVGETLSLSKQTGVTASFEALFNLNKETKASNASDGTTGVAAFKDTRVNAKVGLSTDLWKQLSFGFSFALKYDQNPAARPVPKGAPDGTAFPANHVSWAYADKVDTLTEATLIYTFF
jgi:hypothetical protein